MTKTKRILLTTLAIIGLALAIELCIVYYNANFAVNAKPSICAINEAMNCDGVARTAYSQFFGIPLSLWGVLLYLFFLFMTYVDKIQNAKFMEIFKVFKNPASYIFTIGLLSFTISMILGGISVFKINSICVFCFATYLVDLLIAITAKTKSNSVIQEIKITINDFIDALKDTKNVIIFCILVILFAATLTYTTITNILAPQKAEQDKILKEYKSYANQTDSYELGPKNADVVVHEYIDFNCGGCFMANLYLHRIVSEFSNVKVIQHIVPLEKTCNPNMQHEGHKNSCLKAQYAIAAEKQNKYWMMSDILFQQSPETEEEIIEKARLANFDIKKLKEDANSEATKEEIKNFIKDADSKSVVGTPTMFIGIRMLVGIGSFFDLKNIITDVGGKEKNSVD